MAQPPDPAAPVTYAGAAYKPVYVERRVRIYPIQEHELTTLNMFSTWVTICASAASALTVFALSVLWDMAISPEQAARDIGKTAIGICAGFILVCVVVGVWAHRSKKTELAKILHESRVLGAGSGS